MMILKRKKSKFIYLYLRLFRIMACDEIFNGIKLGKICVSKKIKGWTEIFFYPICIKKTELKLINTVSSRPITNPIYIARQ